MDLTPKISVIIPVYNVKEYLNDCLESVTRQNYRNLEILITDDGSTDGSGELCDRWADRDSRIVVFHQENRGVSSARNTALAAATGDFVAPVDPDDLIREGYFSALLSACVKKETDLSICDYESVDQTYKFSVSENPDFKGKEETEALSDNPDQLLPESNAIVYSAQECLESMYRPKFSGMSFVTWGKMYRRSLFEHLAEGYPDGRIHEDVSTTYRLIYFAKRIAYIPVPLYLYRFRKGSIMHRPFYRDRLNVGEATRQQCDFFLERKESGLAAMAVNNHIRTLFSLLACVQEAEEENNPGGNTSIVHNEDWISQEKLLKEVLREDCSNYLPKVKLPLYKKILYRTASRCPIDRVVRKLRMF